MVSLLGVLPTFACPTSVLQWLSLWLWLHFAWVASPGSSDSDFFLFCFRLRSLAVVLLHHALACWFVRSVILARQFPVLPLIWSSCLAKLEMSLHIACELVASSFDYSEEVRG